jgi:hypothetical protein
MLSHRSDLDEDCPECGAKDWQIRRFVNCGGAITYPYVCGHCGLKTCVCEKKEVALKICSDPIEIQPTEKRHVCEVCGSEGAQRHHWAPSFLFGNAAEMWPTSYLCQTCHTLWQRIVTPAMTQRKQPGGHE